MCIDRTRIRRRKSPLTRALRIVLFVVPWVICGVLAYPSPKEQVPQEEPLPEIVSRIPISKFDITSKLGENVIETEFGTLVRMNLPEDFGDPTDVHSFKPLESYTMITNQSTHAYQVTHHGKSYTDMNGFRRFQTRPSEEFTVVIGMDEATGDVFGLDDYLVAMGTFYKGDSNRVNQRFLILGDHGLYTVRVGDEKRDRDTDKRNMYSFHKRGKGGLLEYIIDSKSPASDTMMYHGNANYGSSLRIRGKIHMIYAIQN